MSHEAAAEYEAILRQIRPFTFNPQLGDIVTRLLGSKEESKIATAIAKMTKTPSSAPPMFQPYPSFRFSRGRGVSGGMMMRGRGVCFKCGQRGHFQRHCMNR
jgi:hypothetical protein